MKTIDNYVFYVEMIMKPALCESYGKQKLLSVWGRDMKGSAK